MCRDIVRQDQYGRLAIAHEVARYGEHKVRVGAEHSGHIFLGHLHLDFGTALHEVWSPGGHAGVIENLWHFRPEPNRLGQHAADNTIRCPLQEVPNEGSADAETHDHEFVDAQVIHKGELVVGV